MHETCFAHALPLAWCLKEILPRLAVMQGRAKAIVGG
jgi:hypothetical protein